MRIVLEADGEEPVELDLSIELFDHMSKQADKEGITIDALLIAAMEAYFEKSPDGDAVALTDDRRQRAQSFLFALGREVPLTVEDGNLLNREVEWLLAFADAEAGRAPGWTAPQHVCDFVLVAWQRHEIVGDHCNICYKFRPVGSKASAPRKDAETEPAGSNGVPSFDPLPTARQLAEVIAGDIQGTFKYDADLIEAAILDSRKELEAQLRQWEEREARSCPEDVGFEEYIARLEARVESLWDEMASR